MIDVGADSWYVIDTQETTSMASVNPYYSYKTYSANDYSAEYEELKPQVYSAYGSNMGNDITLTEDMLINNNFEFSGGTIDLNGHTLTINGNLIQSGGKMYIDGGTLEVNGDYRIQSYEKNPVTDEMEYTNSYGWLNMSKSNDLVKIKGDFYTQSIYGVTHRYDGDKNKLTAGLMEIGGDFNQITGIDFGNYNAEITDNFSCSNTHKVIFNGNKTQHIHFDDLGSKFNQLESSNSEIVWSGSMNITTLCSDIIMNSNNLTIYSINLNGNNAVINNDVLIKSENGSWISECVDLNKGCLTINGNLLHSQGKININGGTLEVNGDYRIQSYEKNAVTDEMEYTNSYGWLNMSKSNDLVKIKGDFYTQSIYGVAHWYDGDKNKLTAGLMEIGGLGPIYYY